MIVRCMSSLMPMRHRGRIVRGETIVETLVSLLIIVGASLALVTAVLSSFRITKAAASRDAQIRSEQNAAAQGPADGAAAAQGTMAFTNADGTDAGTLSVNFYGGNSIASYASDGAGTPYTPPSGEKGNEDPEPSHAGNYVLVPDHTWGSLVATYFRSNYYFNLLGHLEAPAGIIVYMNGAYYVTTGVAAYPAGETPYLELRYLDILNPDALTQTTDLGGPVLIPIDMSGVLDLRGQDLPSSSTAGRIARTDAGYQIWDAVDGAWVPITSKISEVS